MLLTLACVTRSKQCEQCVCSCYFRPLLSSGTKVGQGTRLGQGTKAGQASASTQARSSGAHSADGGLQTGCGGLINTQSFMVDKRGYKEEGKGLKAASSQLLAVREAFAGDDVVEQFEREKAELEAQETVDDTPVNLPGTVIGIALVHTEYDKGYCLQRTPLYIIQTLAVCLRIPLAQKTCLLSGGS